MISTMVFVSKMDRNTPICPNADRAILPFPMGVALANSMKNTVESSKELLISLTGQMQAVGSNNLVLTNAQAHVVPLPPLQ